MSAVIQHTTEAAFLADRLRSQVMRDRDRCTGISSDALALYGVRGGPEPRPFDYPSDLDDVRPCWRSTAPTSRSSGRSTPRLTAAVEPPNATACRGGALVARTTRATAPR